MLNQIKNTINNLKMKIKIYKMKNKKKNNVKIKWKNIDNNIMNSWKIKYNF